jgi:hypothetical protein
LSAAANQSLNRTRFYRNSALRRWPTVFDWRWTCGRMEFLCPSKRPRYQISLPTTRTFPNECGKSCTNFSPSIAGVCVMLGTRRDAHLVESRSEIRRCSQNAKADFEKAYYGKLRDSERGRMRSKRTTETGTRRLVIMRFVTTKQASKTRRPVLVRYD